MRCCAKLLRSGAPLVRDRSKLLLYHTPSRSTLSHASIPLVCGMSLIRRIIGRWNEFHARRDAVFEIVQRAMDSRPTEAPCQSSMLAANVLEMLTGLAAITRGAILEVGAFTGGSIIAVCAGIGLNDRRLVITIEAGGRSDHPTMPTDDILRDLNANLAAARLSERVIVLADHAYDAYPRLRRLLGQAKIGLLIIDADGHMGFHLPSVAPFLAPGCVLVADDYYDELKGARMRAYLAASARSGAVDAIGVCGYSTWIGRVRNPSRFPRMPFVHDANFAWLCRLDFAPSGDTPDEPSRSCTRLFENGVELGPAHSLHDDIRYFGRGRWSHWGRQPYMSASDNTDPTLNGRAYEIDVDGNRIPLT
jgi:predicted O-methyltransferase YrrM